MLEGHCVRTSHAESNAVAQAAKSGARTKGAHAYVNTLPCWPCFRLLVVAGVARVVYRDEYREDPRVREAATIAGVALRSEHEEVEHEDSIARAADTIANMAKS